MYAHYGKRETRKQNQQCFIKLISRLLGQSPSIKKVNEKTYFLSTRKGRSMNTQGCCSNDIMLYRIIKVWSKLYSFFGRVETIKSKKISQFYYKWQVTSNQTDRIKHQPRPTIPLTFIGFRFHLVIVQHLMGHSTFYLSDVHFPVATLPLKSKFYQFNTGIVSCIPIMHLGP